MKEIIKNALEEKGITQKELAEKIHVSPQAVSKWIKGESQPTFDNIKLMTEIFGVEFGDKVLKKGLQDKKVMKQQPSELKDLDTMEKAYAESKRILDEAGASKYSHATYVLLSWLIPAAIGLAYHSYINSKDEESKDLYYEDIFYHLNSYFEECSAHKFQYPNQLDYDFFLMGGDLFESFEPYKLPNHDYANEAMDLWYRFKKVVADDKESTLVDEFKVALAEIISINSCY